MRQSTLILGILMLAAVAAFFYYLGRREQQYAALSAHVIAQSSRVANQDTRIAAVEKTLTEHETRWRFMNRAVDWVRGKLPWC